MSGRALYLDAASTWQVRLDDGVALNISAPGRTRGLYPITRLSRVVSPAHAEWTLQALLACLQAGVPVMFHDARGDAVAWCFGPRRRETTLGHLLREALGRSDWDERFALWYRATERARMLEALRRTGATAASLDAAAVRTQLCNAHRMRVGKGVGKHLHALHAATCALVAERLQSEVGDPQLIGYAKPGRHLGVDAAGLLEWTMHGVLSAMPARDFDMAAPRFAAIVVERHGAQIHRALGALLGDLESCLRDWVW